MTPQLLAVLVVAFAVGFGVAVAVIRVATRPLLDELRGLRRDVAGALGVELSAPEGSELARRFAERSSS